MTIDLLASLSELFSLIGIGSCLLLALFVERIVRIER